MAYVVAGAIGRYALEEGELGVSSMVIVPDFEDALGGDVGLVRFSKACIRACISTGATSGDAIEFGKLKRVRGVRG